MLKCLIIICNLLFNNIAEQNIHHSSKMGDHEGSTERRICLTLVKQSYVLVNIRFEIKKLELELEHDVPHDTKTDMK